jgi:hypothetical protein
MHLQDQLFVQRVHLVFIVQVLKWQSRYLVQVVLTAKEVVSNVPVVLLAMSVHQLFKLLNNLVHLELIL